MTCLLRVPQCKILEVHVFECICKHSVKFFQFFEFRTPRSKEPHKLQNLISSVQISIEMYSSNQQMFIKTGKNDRNRPRSAF